MNATDAAASIAQVCDDVKRTLLEKNRAYGNSALDPLRIFSRAGRRGDRPAPDHSGSGLSFVSGAKGSTSSPATKTAATVRAA